MHQLQPASLEVFSTVTRTIPEIPRNTPEIEPRDLIKGCETFRQAHTTLDQLIEDAVVAGKDLVEMGLSPEEIVDVMAVRLESQASMMQRWIEEQGPYGVVEDNIGNQITVTRGESAGGETIESFRLRLKTASFLMEALWRTLTLFPADHPEAREQRQVVQSELAGQYAEVLYLIDGKRRLFKNHGYMRAARQEATVAVLLSLTPTPQGAYFISSYDDDICSKDGALWYYTAYQQSGKPEVQQFLKQEYVQVKSSPKISQINDQYLNITIVDAFATGNRSFACPSHDKRYVWDTTRALNQLLCSNDPKNKQDSDISYLYSLLYPPDDNKTELIDPNLYGLSVDCDHDLDHDELNAYLKNSRNVIGFLNSLLWPYMEESNYGEWAWKLKTHFTEDDFKRRLAQINNPSNA